MIAQIKGGVVLKENNSLVVITAGGVGYKLFVTDNLLSEISLGDLILLWTHLAVRENALNLYGFKEKTDLEFFEMIVNNISGIGPKKAIGILSVASVETIKRAVRAGDSSYLTKVAGIGQKNAEKIVLELRDKLSKMSENETEKNFSQDGDLLDAIVSLGYSQSQARTAIQKIPENMVGVNERIKEALKILSGK